MVNTRYCRSEVDTLQYVINKFGYREASEPHEGNLMWYGMALRDNDIDYLKNKNCIVNRYPLMDVSKISITVRAALCKEKHLLRDYIATTTLFPVRLPLHAG